MAYASDFYIPENIIGYTGVLNKNPTVYFLSSTRYGHITQVHDMWQNVGREPVRSNAKYEFGNTGDNNCLVELDPAINMSHTSRSPIILVGTGGPPPELTHAIMVHSEEKGYRFGEGMVITKANRSRKHHPGQQPTDDERSSVRVRTIFYWTRTNAVGVPKDARLSAI